MIPLSTILRAQKSLQSVTAERKRRKQSNNIKTADVSPSALKFLPIPLYLPNENTGFFGLGEKRRRVGTVFADLTYIPFRTSEDVVESSDVDEHDHMSDDYDMDDAAIINRVGGDENLSSSGSMNKKPRSKGVAKIKKTSKKINGATPGVI